MHLFCFAFNYITILIIKIHKKAFHYNFTYNIVHTAIIKDLWILLLEKVLFTKIFV